MQNKGHLNKLLQKKEVEEKGICKPHVRNKKYLRNKSLVVKLALLDASSLADTSVPPWTLARAKLCNGK